MTIKVLAADAAGYYSFLGQCELAGATINIPEGAINIGGNGMGHAHLAQTIDPLAKNDGSFNALTLGSDIYIYAIQTVSRVTDFICSKNSTFPTGYTSINSRKIGGFHVGRIRTIANRYSVVYVPTVGILANSVWDLGHRPKVSPEGMAQLSSGLWFSIYQLSIISGSYPQAIAGSRFGVMPLRSTPFNELDVTIIAMQSGFRIPTFREWAAIADGSPQGNNANNDTAWTATANTGPTNTGSVAKAVSCLGAVDCVGNVWEAIAGDYDVGNATNAFAWDAAVVNTGVDGAIARGQTYHAAWRYAVAGAGWAHGALSGSRTLYTSAGALAASGGVGVRGVSESI